MGEEGGAQSNLHDEMDCLAQLPGRMEVRGWHAEEEQKTNEAVE